MGKFLWLWSERSESIYWQCLECDNTSFFISVIAYKRNIFFLIHNYFSFKAYWWYQEKWTVPAICSYNTSSCWYLSAKFNQFLWNDEITAKITNRSLADSRISAYFIKNGRDSFGDKVNESEGVVRKCVRNTHAERGRWVYHRLTVIYIIKK